MRRLGSALLALVVFAATALLGAAVTAGTAAAVVVNPFTLNYDQAIYGDFIEIGNGNLRCPTAVDGAFFLPGKTPAGCAAGQTVAGTADGNNNYFMLQNNGGGVPGAFNSSTAALTIPPGATVDFARLNWGGDTGRFKLANGTFSSVPSCTAAGQLSPPSGSPSVPPPGSPTTQHPQITVGPGATFDVTPTQVTTDPDAAVGNNQEQYYTGYADITADFDTAARATSLPITVANIWSPAGINCFAGWSLVVVYKYPQITPVYAPSKKEVFVYDGHVRQGAADPPTVTDVTGFRSASPTDKVGITAYEGDRQINGDQLKINNIPVTDGQYNTTTNFFVSHADGATSPSVPYNYSVDANGFTTTAIPVGATSATVAFSTSGDGYVAQNLVLSLAVPELQVTKTVTPTVAHPGDPVVYTVTVTNPSTANATGVQVLDPLLPDCGGTLPVLPGLASHTFTCDANAPDQDSTNTATATGKSDLGDDLSGSAIAALRIVHPGVSIVKTTDKPAYRPGERVTYTIVVTNTGDQPLSDTSVADPTTPGCAKTIGDLPVGATTTYTCTDTAPVPGDANAATVTARDSVPVGGAPGKTVTDRASVPVPVIHSGISITKVAAPTTIRAGETVTYTIAVTNTGDAALSPVTVADPDTAACATTIPGGLAAHAVYTYTCTASPASTMTNTATVTGTDLAGGPVTDTADATVTVIHPGLALTKTADRGPHRPSDTVTFTLTLHNTGDTTLTDVAVADPSTAGCARTFPTLTAGGTQTWQCTTTAGSDNFTNTATATGNDPTGRAVTDTATAPVDVIHPSIDITKTAAPTAVRVGDRVTYTITVHNTGDTTLSDVAVTDPSTPACASTLGTLAAAATRTYTCTVTAGSADIINAATATGTPPTGTPVSDTDTATVTVTHPAVTLSKTASPTVVRPGQTVTYSILVRNSGDVPLSDVAVTDPSTPACARTFASIAVSDFRTYSCTVVAGAADRDNTAAVTGTPPLGAAVGGSDSAHVQVIHPALQVAKTADVTQARPGDPITYTIVATNTGNTALTDVQVVDPLLPGCTATVPTLAAGASSPPLHCTTTAPSTTVTNTATATGTPPDGAAVEGAATATVTVIHPAVTITKVADHAQVRPGDLAGFQIQVTNTGDVALDPIDVADPSAPDCARAIPGPLAPAETQSYHCSVTAGDADFTNTATATGTDPTGHPATDTAQAPVNVIHPAITLSKTVTPSNTQTGQSIQYTIVVTNSGDVALANAVVSDPAVVACAHTIAVLAPGESRSYTCPFVAPTGTFANTATVTASPPVGSDVTDTATAQLRVDHPHLSLSKTADVTTARPGDPITFRITVVNDGDVPLDTAVVDPSFTGCAKTLGTLAVQEEQTYSCTVAAPRDSLVNTAVATGTPPSGPAVNATGSVPVTVIHPSIEITKTGPTGPVRAGEPVTFTISVSNAGDVSLTDVTVTDPNAPDCSRALATLPPGGGAQPSTVTFTCTGAAQPDDYVNVATVTGTDPLGHPLAADAHAPVEVIHPAVSLLKTVDPSTARAGNPVQYRFTAINTGDVPLTVAALTDPRLPTCAHTFTQPFPVGARLDFLCPAFAPAQDLTNTATVTADAPVGAAVTATANAALDVVHPAITLTKVRTPMPGHPVRPGDPVTFQITVSNTGDVPLTGVTVTDPLVPSCTRTIGTLPAGATTPPYTCTMAALPAKYTNTATVIGSPAIGPPVFAHAQASVPVIHPAITITKTGPDRPVRAGGTAAFTITVTNTGDATLHNVTIADPQAVGCAHTLPALSAGATLSYRCAAAAGNVDFTNTATVTGVDITGRTVTDHSTAPVHVVHPDLTLSKAANVPTALAGAPITFTLIATNAGDITLIGLTVTDPSAPACTRTIGTLTPGAHLSFSCTITAPASTYTNTATATGQPACPAGNTASPCLTPIDNIPVQATASATVPRRQHRPGHRQQRTVSPSRPQQGGPDTAPVPATPATRNRRRCCPTPAWTPPRRSPPVCSCWPWAS